MNDKQKELIWNAQIKGNGFSSKRKLTKELELEVLKKGELINKDLDRIKYYHGFKRIYYSKLRKKLFENLDLQMV